MPDDLKRTPLADTHKKLGGKMVPFAGWEMPVQYPTGILAEHTINIATLRLTRKQRGGDAFMVIEVDHEPSLAVRDELRALPWVRWAYRLDKVSA